MFTWLVSQSTDTPADSGGGGSDWLGVVIAAVALIVAIIAAVFARRSAIASERSAIAAERAPAIARQQEIRDDLRAEIEPVRVLLKSLIADLSLGNQISPVPHELDQASDRIGRIGQRQDGIVERSSTSQVGSFIFTLGAIWQIAEMNQQAVSRAHAAVDALPAQDSSVGSALAGRAAEARAAVTKTERARSASMQTLRERTTETLRLVEVELKRLDALDQQSSRLA